MNSEKNIIQSLTWRYACKKFDQNKKLGLAYLGADSLNNIGWLQINKKSYGFFESFGAGVKKTFSKLGDYISQFKLIFSPSTGAYKGMGGFASMTQAFGGSWDWEYFWGITAFFSVALAFMNFLPIPMLDGGYILFTLIEMITGKKLPDRIMEKINMIPGLITKENIFKTFSESINWLSKKYSK